MSAVLIPATSEHAKRIHISQIHLDVFWRGSTPQAHALKLIQGSLEAWTWEVDGQVGCIFGVEPGCLVTGFPLWLLSTAVLRRHPMAFLRGCLRYKAEFLARYPIICGYCDTAFGESRRWLEWLGAHFDPPQPWQDDLSYSRFQLYRE